MACDAFVVQFRRRRCADETGWLSPMAFSLYSCGVAGGTLLCVWVWFLWRVVHLNESSFSVEMVRDFALCAVAVYPLWLTHYIIVVRHLNKMVQWMEAKLDKQ